MAHLCHLLRNDEVVKVSLEDPQSPWQVLRLQELVTLGDVRPPHMVQGSATRTIFATSRTGSKLIGNSAVHAEGENEASARITTGLDPGLRV
jgi:hypothetical protein